MSDFDNAVEIKGLTKKYDGFTLDNISFNVPRGSIMGFIGQNGAGKTTTINSLLGIVRPDSGEIRILGMDARREESEIKKHISAVFDELPFQDVFTPRQIEIFLKDIYEEWDSGKFRQYLDAFSLPFNKRTGTFSRGMKMKLQIAAALSHNARLLIMDEATSGLDPVVRNEILDIFLEYLQDENNSILMSSHITSDLEKISDRVTFIDKGKVLLSGCKDEILDSHGVLKCSKKDYESIDPADFVSARIHDFGAELLIPDRAACAKKYSGAVIDSTTLEEIMLFYVRGRKKEWSEEGNN